MKKPFLLLELLIGLFLVSMCALPLVRLPMRTLQEETKSAWRMMMHRYADLAYAQIREELYTRKIDWEILSTPRKEKAVVLDDEITIDMAHLGKRTFKRKGYLWSVGKKDKENKELRLVTFQVQFQTVNRFKLFRSKSKQTLSTPYTYQLLAEEQKPAPQHVHND